MSRYCPRGRPRRAKGHVLRHAFRCRCVFRRLRRQGSRRCGRICCRRLKLRLYKHGCWVQTTPIFCRLQRIYRDKRPYPSQALRPVQVWLYSLFLPCSRLLPLIGKIRKTRPGDRFRLFKIRLAGGTETGIEVGVRAVIGIVIRIRFIIRIGSCIGKV